MKIYYSTASPFVRKCLVVAHERGFAERIEHLPQAAHPIYRNDINLLSDNPLGQLPTFVCDDGQVLYDSRVICEYLDSLPAGSRLIPEDGPERWDCLTAQSLADGMTGAALLARYEKLMRPESLQWPVWADAQLQKVQSGLVWLDRAAPNFGGHVDLGKIAFACTLAYLDFRFPALPWRTDAPAAARWFSAFSERASMKATAYQELSTPLSASPRPLPE
jgi:glutathione S-transferase